MTVVSKDLDIEKETPSFMYDFDKYKKDPEKEIAVLIDEIPNPVDINCLYNEFCSRFGNQSCEIFYDSMAKLLNQNTILMEEELNNVKK